MKMSLGGHVLWGKLLISKEKGENHAIIVKKKTKSMEYLEGDSTIHDYLQMVGLWVTFIVGWLMYFLIFLQQTQITYVIKIGKK